MPVKGLSSSENDQVSCIIQVTTVSLASPVRTVSLASLVRTVSLASLVRTVSLVSLVRTVSLASLVRTVSPAIPVSRLGVARLVSPGICVGPVGLLTPVGPIRLDTLWAGSEQGALRFWNRSNELDPPDARCRQNSGDRAPDPLIALDANDRSPAARERAGASVAVTVSQGCRCQLRRESGPERWRYVAQRARREVIKRSASRQQGQDPFGDLDGDAARRRSRYNLVAFATAVEQADDEGCPPHPR